MIDEKMAGIIGIMRKLTLLSLTLNAVIDAGQHEGISIDEVRAEVENKTIFLYLNRFELVANWGTGNLSEDDKYHLIGEWQSMANAIDAKRKMGVKNNGICLLLAYVIEGIQMRTFSEEVWPCPDPW